MARRIPKIGSVTKIRALTAAITRLKRFEQSSAPDFEKALARDDREDFEECLRELQQE